MYIYMYGFRIIYTYKVLFNNIAALNDVKIKNKKKNCCFMRFGHVFYRTAHFFSIFERVLQQG